VIRTPLLLLALLLSIPPMSLLVMVAAYLGVEDRPDGVYDFASRTMARMINWFAGVTVVQHGLEHVKPGEAHVLSMNHTSWFDVFALAMVLPHYKFVGKAELKKIPIFGRGATAWGIIWVERENRKQAFTSYEFAAKRIRGGVNVVVAPEGTRGDDYTLRPFKKGPFVLAIAAQVPVIPVVLHGSREAMPRGSFRTRPATIHVHYLPPISTAGMTYEDRESLATQCWTAMAGFLEREYGVVSPPLKAPRPDARLRATDAEPSALSPQI
jgi:1-acyl-sn-glycerol-3-phosphate acyltransferase